jgi:hypothetical protein
LTTFAQLSARLKNFLRGWLLDLGLKEGFVECATVCVKSVVILLFFYIDGLCFKFAINHKKNVAKHAHLVYYCVFHKE